MKAIILARVSTEEQKQAGNSLPAQQARLRSYIDRSAGLELFKEFIFDESAYKEHRKEFEKIVEFIVGLKEVIALCGDKVDRLTRDFLVGLPTLEKLRREGKIELHFPSDNLVLHQDSPATDLFHFNIAVSLAQYYSNAISDNTKRANEQRRRNGDWNGGVRTGYMHILLDNGKKDIVFDPERAHLIERLFQLYATGNYSLTTVRDEITKLGLRSRTGKVLSRGNIEFILKDPFFYGMAKSKKYGPYPHRYKAIISIELYEQCQAVFRSRHKSTSKPVSDLFMFKGLMHCKNCGCVMTPEIKKGYLIYYSCTNAKGNCKRVYVREEDLLKPIQAVFSTFEKIPKKVEERLVHELRALNEGEVEFHKKELARIRAEYDRTQTRIDSLVDLLVDKSITKDDYDKKLQEFKDKQYRLDIEAEEHTKADHDYKIVISQVFSLSRRMGAIFTSSEPHEKRAILNFLLQNPVVSGKKLEFTLTKPFDTVLEVANCPSGLPDLDSNQDTLLQRE